MSIVYLDDGQGGSNKTIRFTGVNVQIVNGLGSTSGTGSPIDFVGVTNGTGNLIVGYNEATFFPGAPPLDRTGSHNVVVGYGHNYTKFGGAVFGRENALNGAYSSILSGTSNASDAVASAIVSGLQNTLTFGSGATFDSVIVGGGQNDILGGKNVIVGGLSNQIIGGSVGASSRRGRRRFQQPHPGRGYGLDRL